MVRDADVTAVWSGVFMLGNVKIHCHVLKDGRRIVDPEDVANYLNDRSIPTAEQLKVFRLWQKGEDA